MEWKVSLDYLTGAGRVRRNHFFSEEVVPGKKRTVKQMFLQPYESTDEFISCLRHTSFAMLGLGCAILNPYQVVLVPAVIVSIAGLCAVFGGMAQLCGYESGASFFLDAAEFFVTDLAQAALDLFVLPLSASIMLTRGTSTLLNAAGAGKDEEELAEHTHQNACC